MEALARVVHGNPHIEGLQYADKVKKIGLIADDTLLIFKARPRGVQEVDRILREFSDQVELKINYEKSVASVLGKNPPVSGS